MLVRHPARNFAMVLSRPIPSWSDATMLINFSPLSSYQTFQWIFAGTVLPCADWIDCWELA